MNKYTANAVAEGSSGPKTVARDASSTSADKEVGLAGAPTPTKKTTSSQLNGANSSPDTHTDLHETTTTQDTLQSSISSDEIGAVNVLPEHNHEFLQTIAGVAGNILEWYDFAVFGFFSDIIGEVFFPPQAGHSQTVESFVVFGLAFLMRPVGGVIMGYIGDVYGRKKALVLSIFLMAFPTFAMGCLPSYDRVGPIAIVLLILTRMLQGMSVGGQLVSSLVFTLENHDKAVWGLYGSFVMAAANFGTLLGNLVAFVLLNSSMSDDQLRAYGWRIPFWSGILVSISGFYLKGAESDDNYAATTTPDVPSAEERTYSQEETGDGLALDATDSKVPSIPAPIFNPLEMAFAKKNRRALASASMVPMLWAAGFYLSFVWMATYMKELAAHPVEHSFGVNAFALLLSVCVFFPVAGSISDRIGRKRTMTLGATLVFFLGPVVVWIIGLGNAWGALAAQMVLGVSLSFWGAPMCAWLVESFDPEIRLTSVAIGYNVAQALAGGMSPAIATIVADRVSVNSPGWIFTVLAFVSLTGLRVVAPPRNHNAPLHSGRFAPIRTASSVHYEEQDKVLTAGDHELL
ncbi:hypothetical protein ACA910_019682 [Epithemia clementina (nom. ined.)]